LLYLLSGVVFLACTSPFARASVLSGVPDCSATGGDWSCYLPGIFRFLLVIAIILGLVLAGVIFLAVKSYLKNKDEKVGS
jgi:hypothetical protein